MKKRSLSALAGGSLFCAKRNVFQRSACFKDGVKRAHFFDIFEKWFSISAFEGLF
jgi:hypothetical protein